MRPIDRRRETERRIRAGRQHARARHRERAAELIEVLLVGQVRRLVEPFRHQQLGGNAVALASVREPHARAHEHLRGLRQRDHAEAERQAQAHVALEEAHLAHAQAGSGGAHYRSGFFPMSRACMSLIWRLMTFSRYSACFMGARLR
jgi:hypothetical protein